MRWLVIFVIVWASILGVVWLCRTECRYTRNPTDVIRGLLIINEGRSNHQYYLDHPELQNTSTGNSSFQEGWIENYNFLESLILTR